MLTRTLQVLGGIAAFGLLVWIAFAASFRTKFPPVLDRIRRMNRAVTNPRQLQKAGRPGSYASVVHHRGRTTGEEYRTPVVVVPANGDDYLIALPYGSGSDWVRNVIAAGGATIEHEGRAREMTNPELVPLDEANPHFPVKEQFMHRLYGVREFLRLQEAAARSVGKP